MDESTHEDTRSEEERLASYRYWQSRTPSERFAKHGE
jgi:hypothetical protein